MAFDRMPSCKLVISSVKDEEFTALSCGRLSPLAALGDTDGRISLYKLGEDQSSSTSLWTKRRHKGSCRSIVMDANDQYMLSAGNDKVAKVTDVLVGSVIWKNVKLHERLQFGPIRDSINTTCWSLERPNLFFTGDDSGALRIFDTRSDYSVLRESRFHGDYVSSILELDKNRILTTGGEGTICVHDIRKLQKDPIQSEDQEEDLLSSCILKNKTRVAIGQLNGVTSFFKDGEWDDQIDRLAPLEAEVSVDSLLPIDSNGDFMAVGLGNGQIWKASVMPNKYVSLLGFHEDAITVNAMGLCYDNTHILSISGQEAKLWPLIPDVASRPLEEASFTNKEKRKCKGKSGSKKKKTKPIEKKPIFEGLV